MKKITITTAILIVGTILVNAETEGQKPPRIYPIRNIAPAQAMSSSSRVAPPKLEEGRPVSNMLQQMVTTGDAETDAKIKALNVEMEAKIKSIRDEYQAKLKEIIGTRKIINSTSTRPMMPRDQEGNDQRFGSSTDNNGNNIPPRPRREYGEVKGVNTEDIGQVVGQDVGSRMKSFFGSLFGR